MSAGVSDQRMKGQGNQATNVSKDQQLDNTREEVNEASWRHQQQQSYAPQMSSATDPYNAGYYGTTALPYQAFGVGDGTWSTNGTEPMTFLGGYDSYGMDGVFGPSTTQYSTAFGQASTFNYFHGNGDYSTWGQVGRAKQYDDYYRPDGLYVPDGIKAVEAGVQNLTFREHKTDKERMAELKEISVGSSQQKKMTWASIASQPAKPTPSLQGGGIKKKGPGMPPPPIVPGKHNMDIGTWESGKNAPVVTAPPPPPPQAPPTMPLPASPAAPLPRPPPQHAMPQQHVPPLHVPPQHAPPQHALPQHAPPQHAPPQHVPQHIQLQHPPPQAWAHAPRAPPPMQIHASRPPMPAAIPEPISPQPQSAPSVPHPLLDELRVKNDYNPKEFDLSAPMARFFVIKSYSEDDIHRSIKYEIWCSTEHGNKRLDSAFREREKEGGVVYLLFSVNGSGHFCGMARMMSAVDYNSNSSVWAQDKWKGQFRVKWIYVKDVPNSELRYIRLENNENKPVTNSRDTQEVPHARGLQVLRIMHNYCHSTSIFDDFIHYERRQEEEDSRKAPQHAPDVGREENEGGKGYRNYRQYRDVPDARDGREGKEQHRDAREHRDYRDSREHRDGRDHRDRDDHGHGYRDRDSNYRPRNKDRDGSRGHGRSHN